jgi:membrane-bound lytic murein transglycosylase D
VLLPYDSANRFLRELAAHRGPMASWTAWVAPRTLPPAEAARLVGMPEAQLREINFIPPRMSVRGGSTLLVPRGTNISKDVSEHVADNGTMALAPQTLPERRVSFKAGAKGDSVAAVAKRYKLSPAMVAQWNKVGPQAAFKAGQTVVVMLPAAASRPGKRSARPAATTPKTRVAQR